MYNFKFKTKPYDHQLKALENSWQKEEFALLMDMGTGKSKVLIDTIAALYDAGKIDSAVIFAPKGVYKNWVAKELPAHMPEHIECNIAYWASPLTVAHKDSIRAIWVPNYDLHIFVMNIEALSVGKAEEVATKFIRSHQGRTLVAIDESTVIKNHSAKRTKASIRVSKIAKYKRILTGSPITKSPLDLYSQFLFLNEELLGFRSYYAFCSRYADMIRRTSSSHSYNQILGFRNLEELTESIQPFSYRVTKDECLDLPDKNYIKRSIELTPEQKKMYNQMKKTAVALLDDMEMVTANAVITQLLRLHQISCGFVNTDDGNLVRFKNNRMSELLSILEEVDGKIIIWANYLWNIHQINHFLKVRYGEESTVSIFGEVNVEDRKKAVERIQTDENTRFLVGNPTTGGFGLTLTACNTVIYFSNNYNLEVRKQSEDRAHRIGQKGSVLYIDIVARNTLDEAIMKSLTNKGQIAAKTLGEEDLRDWLL